MTKRTIILIAAAVVVLTLGVAGSWLYWETELSLSGILPEENWISLELWVGEPGSGDTKIDSPALEDVLGAIGKTNVTRASAEDGFFVPYFRLTLYKGESYPTLLYVAQNGRITVAVELDLDNYQYYKGGEELYQALLELTS